MLLLPACVNGAPGLRRWAAMISQSGPPKYWVGGLSILLQPACKDCLASSDTRPPPPPPTHTHHLHSPRLQRRASGGSAHASSRGWGRSKERQGWGEQAAFTPPGANLFSGHSDCGRRTGYGGLNCHAWLKSLRGRDWFMCCMGEGGSMWGARGVLGLKP